MNCIGVFVLLLTLLLSLPPLSTAFAVKRNRWNPIKFIKTVSFFEAAPSIPFLKKRVPQSATSAMNQGDTIWTKSRASELQWGVLDDGVMGGVSETTSLLDGLFSGEFSGITRTENNGGFAGIRTKLFDVAKNIEQCTGFELKVKGDGQRYKFIARDDTDWNGTAWSFSFDTKKDETITVRVPVSDLKPTKFARILRGGPAFNRKNLTCVQISLSKFEYEGELNPSFNVGPFCLNVESIGVY